MCQFLAPEVDKFVQFIGPETDRMFHLLVLEMVKMVQMGQFLGPETDIMFERYFCVTQVSMNFNK